MYPECAEPVGKYRAVSPGTLGATSDSESVSSTHTVRSGPRKKAASGPDVGPKFIVVDEKSERPGEQRVSENPIHVPTESKSPCDEIAKQVHLGEPKPPHGDPPVGGHHGGGGVVGGPPAEAKGEEYKAEYRSSSLVDGFDILQRNWWPQWLPSPTTLAAGVASTITYCTTQRTGVARVAAAVAVGAAIVTGIKIVGAYAGAGFPLSRVQSVPTTLQGMSIQVEEATVSPVFQAPNFIVPAVDVMLGKPVIRVGRVQKIGTAVIDNGEIDVRSFSANSTELKVQPLSATLVERFDAITGAVQKCMVVDHVVDACKAGADLVPVDDLQSVVTRKIVNNTCLNLTADQYAKNSFGTAQFLRDWMNNRMTASTFQAPRLNFVGGVALCSLGMVTLCVTFPRLSYQSNMIVLKSSGMLIKLLNQACTSCRHLLALL